MIPNSNNQTTPAASGGAGQCACTPATTLTRRTLLLTTTATLSLPILQNFATANPLPPIENQKSGGGKIKNLSDPPDPWLPTTLKPTDLPDHAFDLSLARSHKILLARAGNHIFALSNRCTHRGCTVAPSKTGGLFCGCHGAKFDNDGSVKNGPAQKPLPRFPLRLSSAGTIEVDPSRKLDPSDPASSLSIPQS